MTDLIITFSKLSQIVVVSPWVGTILISIALAHRNASGSEIFSAILYLAILLTTHSSQHLVLLPGFCYEVEGRWESSLSMQSCELCASSTYSHTQSRTLIDMAQEEFTALKLTSIGCLVCENRYSGLPQNHIIAVVPDHPA